MGGCLSLSPSGSRRRRRGRGEQSGANGQRGRRSGAGDIQSQPLKPVKPKWKSDIPITDGQLRSKRDEFWETAPAFEGRREIWDALKAAAVALETGDHSLAQAIIDGANILLPYGTLTDCYDELGNRYQLPVYVLSSPVNLIEEMSGDSDNINELADIQPGGKDIMVGIRLSTGRELKLKVNTGESIHHLKRRVFELEGIDPNKQRFLFCGHLLVDRDRLTAIKIPKGFMLQVMIVEPVTVQSSSGGNDNVLNGNTDKSTDSPAPCDADGGDKNDSDNQVADINAVLCDSTVEERPPVVINNDPSSMRETTAEAIEMTTL